MKLFYSRWWANLLTDGPLWVLIFDRGAGAATDRVLTKKI